MFVVVAPETVQFRKPHNNVVISRSLNIINVNVATNIERWAPKIKILKTYFKYWENSKIIPHWKFSDAFMGLGIPIVHHPLHRWITQQHLNAKILKIDWKPQYIQGNWAGYNIKDSALTNFVIVGSVTSYRHTPNPLNAL